MDGCFRTVDRKRRPWAGLVPVTALEGRSSGWCGLTCKTVTTRDLFEMSAGTGTTLRTVLWRTASQLMAATAHINPSGCDSVQWCAAPPEPL